jgi:hypothetical protein
MIRTMSAFRMTLAAAIATVLVLAPPVARDAAACSCGERVPCAVAGLADVVFIGTVLEAKRETIGGSLGWTVHTIAVTKVLRGSAEPMLTLVPAVTVTPADVEASKGRSDEISMTSSCDYQFEVGEQYVIYAQRTPSGRWTTSQCAGTKRLAEADADLDYFAELFRSPPDARIYGSVTRIVRDRAVSSGVGEVPAPGVKLALSGPSGDVTITSDAAGTFDVRVPPGQYSLVPLVPESVKVYGGGGGASVPAYGCARVRFSFTPNGRVQGRVVRPDGTPAQDASVDLVPADEPFDPSAGSSWAPSTTVDRQGRFVIDALMPGRYLLAINARHGPRQISPYAPSYLTARDGERQVLTVGDGESLTGVNLVVTPLTETTIAGHVAFADGRPPAEANLVAVPISHRGAVAGSTKANGTGDFELRVFSGLTYVIRAGVSTPGGYRMMEMEMTIEGPLEGVRLIMTP